jgi:DNA polymerase-4
VDEAYLEATGLERIFGSVDALARNLQKEILENAGLTCSIGLAPVKFLAKIASDMRKPAGLTILAHAGVADFLRSLPVGKIPGVGPSMLKNLELLGVRTAADAQRFPREFWKRRLGKAGEMLHDRAHGNDPRPVTPYRAPKSESAENTFARDTGDADVLSAWLLRQAERVGKRLRRQGLAGRTVTLKLKFADFTQTTRSRTLTEPTNLTRILYETALELLREKKTDRPLRLIGLGVSHFSAGEKQLFLLPDPAEEALKREAALDAALDALRDRFGASAVIRGKLFSGEKDRSDESP